MRNESNPLLILTAPLMVKMMLVTGEGQELRQVNLSLATKNLITDKNTTVHPAKAFSQVYKSPFTHRIEAAKLMRRFH